MGMCILRLPAPVIEVEAPKLAPIVTEVSYFAQEKADEIGNNQYIFRNASRSTSCSSPLTLYTMRR
jgi:hypothetical protein